MATFPQEKQFRFKFFNALGFASAGTQIPLGNSIKGEVVKNTFIYSSKLSLQQIPQIPQ